MSHADLVHTLWRCGDAGGGEAPPDVAAKLQEHLACVDSLARRCLSMAEASAPPAFHP